MSPYVPRTKQAKNAVRDNTAVAVNVRTVTLDCGCATTGLPQVSSPDRWWCCGRWRHAR